ncbi:unnamed protein product [Cochlearia groenlandica]
MYSLILHGRRRRSSLDLQKWRISSKTLSKLLQNPSSSSSLAPDSSSINRREGNAYTISYLVESLGLTFKIAESISKKVKFNEKTNPDSVVNLLKSHGFTDSQISTIVTIHPKLLISDSEKSLAPKLNLLLSRGASSSELTEIISKVPEILAKKRSISVYYDFVREVIEGDKSLNFDKVCVSLPPQGSKQENKIKNLSVLRELGMPYQLLFPLLVSNCPYVCGKAKFDESLKKVLEMGFVPTSLRFVEALRIVQGYKTETIDMKIDVYKRLGFVEEEIWSIFKKYPIFLQLSEKKIAKNFETMKMCGLLEDEVLLVVKKFPQCIGVSEKNILNSVETFLGLGFSKEDFAAMVKRLPACIGYSVETVKKKMEFVVNQMKWPLNAVVMYPNVLGYSMEKRIVPRCNVIKALMSKGTLRSEEPPPLSSVLVCTDHAFLNRYVMKRRDEKLVTELMAIFTRR